MNDKIGTEQINPIVWMNPDTLPIRQSDFYNEALYWVAIEYSETKKVKCFIAEVINGVWCDTDSSSGELEDIGTLLAWAEYEAPVFIF